MGSVKTIKQGKQKENSYNLYGVVVDTNYPYVLRAPATGKSKENGETVYVCAMKIIDRSNFSESEYSSICVSAAFLFTLLVSLMCQLVISTLKLPFL